MKGIPVGNLLWHFFLGGVTAIYAACVLGYLLHLIFRN